MTTFSFTSFCKGREEDIKAQARMRAFFALRKAWRDRSENFGMKAKDLAEILCRDKGRVSKILSGRNRTMTLETLAVFLDALGYYLPLDPVRYEDLPRTNHDVRPETSSVKEIPLEVLQHRATPPTIPGPPVVVTVEPPRAA